MLLQSISITPHLSAHPSAAHLNLLPAAIHTVHHNHNHSVHPTDHTQDTVHRRTEPAAHLYKLVVEVIQKKVEEHLDAYLTSCTPGGGGSASSTDDQLSLCPLADQTAAGSGHKQLHE
ncbi:hypothetical protein HanRHA438_Chr12g0540601 [Helianthus annuus]|nr:hypothetical protein HanRHA438_Chr12g0540601 [Helianthus annuus]